MFDECGGDSEAKDVVAMGDAVHAASEEHEGLPKQGGVMKQFCKTLFMLIIMTVLVCGAGWQVWQLRQARTDAPVPLDYMVKASEYRGTELSKNGAVFTATFDLEIFNKEGWKKIPLVPSHVALRDAKLPDGSYLLLEGGMYTVLTEEDGEMQIEISFSIAATERDGKYAVDFKRIPSVTCVLDATFPREGLDVKVAGSQSTDVTTTNGATRVIAALPDDTPIGITWEEALPEIEKGPSKYYTETRTLISIAEGLIIGQSRIDFTVLHTPTRELKMRVPEGVGVLEISGSQIRDWRVTDGVLAVQLDREVIGPYTLAVKYESSPDMADGKVKLPVVTGDGVVREKGEIGVVALANVEVSNDTVNKAHVMDAKELPVEMSGMTTRPILLAYRYVEPEFSVAVDIKKHLDVDVLRTLIDRAAFSIMQTFDGRRITRARYNVRNNRNQFLRIALPDGADLWSAAVDGRSVQPSKDDKGNVLLPLLRSQGRGMSAFPVELVYAEKGVAPGADGRGVATVAMPQCSEPIMHMLVSLYVPREGKYRDFEGTLRLVDQFRDGVSRPVQALANNRQPIKAQQQRVAADMAAVRAAAPMEVQLPMSGKVYLLEKILVVDDAQSFSYAFSKLTK